MPSRTARLAGRPAVLLPIDPFDEDTQTAQSNANLYRYCRRNVVDHLKIWRDCIEDCLDRRTQAVFQGFLLDYCRSNTKRVIVLGDREVIWTYTITTKSAATEIWRTLVAAADKRAIAPLRRNATEAQRWKLCWDIKVEGTRAGPVFIIVKWIKTHLTPLLELEVDLPYSKRGFTLDDIALFADTLWLRPHLIPLSPLQRLSVHGAVPFAGLGGFRPGMLEHLEYDQFRVLLVRDGAGRRRVAVHCKIYTNKRRGLNRQVQFTILAVPDPRYCVVRILIPRAIQADAFEAGYKSYDELIRKPTFDGNTRIIRLNWKQHLLDEKAEILPPPTGRFGAFGIAPCLSQGIENPPARTSQGWGLAGD
ncbi:hypothetical protein B0T25DRAFT_59035 [Lasiosphaeria hispida]|uniref:Uncharacterized protein n=1 Tax=Lasiosphaeria hispida TaxID=260671 RepID=A0AAJ0HWL3_9PEZI|nr:hypothetical protein B0T25DRAFT_59035 [Lasiosphaeria hispida]